MNISSNGHSIQVSCLLESCQSIMGQLCSNRYPDCRRHRWPKKKPTQQRDRVTTKDNKKANDIKTQVEYEGNIPKKKFCGVINLKP